MDEIDCFYDTIIYHSGCVDGYTAVTIAKSRVKMKTNDKQSMDVICKMASHGQPPPKHLHGRRILLLDFCYPLQDMLYLLKICTKVMVIDHHEKTKEMLIPSIWPPQNLIYDINKCGAVLTFEYFYPHLKHNKLPLFLQYVQDLDLNLLQIDQHKEFASWIRSVPWSTSFYSAFLWQQDYFLNELRTLGKVCLAKDELIIKSIVPKAIFCIQSFPGTPSPPNKEEEEEMRLYTVAYVNSTILQTEIALELFHRYPCFDFVAIYSFNDKIGCTSFCLRSQVHYGVNVNTLAQKIATTQQNQDDDRKKIDLSNRDLGGGHPHASGYKKYWYSNCSLPHRLPGCIQTYMDTPLDRNTFHVQQLSIPLTKRALTYFSIYNCLTVPTFGTSHPTIKAVSEEKKMIMQLRPLEKEKVNKCHEICHEIYIPVSCGGDSTIQPSILTLKWDSGSAGSGSGSVAGNGSGDMVPICSCCIAKQRLYSEQTHHLAYKIVYHMLNKELWDKKIWLMKYYIQPCDSSPEITQIDHLLSLQQNHPNDNKCKNQVHVIALTYYDTVKDVTYFYLKETPALNKPLRYIFHYHIKYFHDEEEPSKAIEMHYRGMNHHLK
jgi:hypothetical protein